MKKFIHTLNQVPGWENSEALLLAFDAKRYVFLTSDDENEEYYIGILYNGTCTKPPYVKAEPIFTGTLLQCIYYFNNTVID